MATDAELRQVIDETRIWPNGLNDDTATLERYGKILLEQLADALEARLDSRLEDR